MLVDPSSGKEKGDNVAIGAFDVFDGEPVLDELAVGKIQSRGSSHKCYQTVCKTQLQNNRSRECRISRNSWILD